MTYTRTNCKNSFASNNNR